MKTDKLQLARRFLMRAAVPDESCPGATKDAEKDDDEKDVYFIIIPNSYPILF